MADPPASPLDAALGRVGDRWALLVVHALLDGPRRFGDLQETVSGIAPNVLTQRLRHLEREGVVVAEPYSKRPLRFVYRLSAAGEDLAGVLRLLAHWGAGSADRSTSGHRPEPVTHPACGTPLEPRWWCPTCERPVAEADAVASDDLRYL